MKLIGLIIFISIGTAFTVTKTAIKQNKILTGPKIDENGSSEFCYDSVTWDIIPITNSKIQTNN